MCNPAPVYPTSSNCPPIGLAASSSGSVVPSSTVQQESLQFASMQATLGPLLRAVCAGPATVAEAERVMKNFDTEIKNAQVLFDEGNRLAAAAQSKFNDGRQAMDCAYQKCITGLVHAIKTVDTGQSAATVLHTLPQPPQDHGSPLHSHSDVNVDGINTLDNYDGLVILLMLSMILMSS